MPTLSNGERCCVTDVLLCDGCTGDLTKQAESLRELISFGCQTSEYEFAPVV